MYLFIECIFAFLWYWLSYISSHYILYIYFLKRFYLFTFRERRWEGGREGEKHGCMRETSTGCLSCPQSGAWPARNWTGNLLVHRLALNLLSHTSQGCVHTSKLRLCVRGRSRVGKLRALDRKRYKCKSEVGDWCVQRKQGDQCGWSHSAEGSDSCASGMAWGRPSNRFSRQLP